MTITIKVKGLIGILLEKREVKIFSKKEIPMKMKHWLSLLCLTALLCTNARAQWKPETGLIIKGKVVTMNDAGDVLPNAQVWLANGKIVAIAKAGDSLPEAAKDAVVIETKGAIYPGMIDLHNHPDYGIYPLMPIKKKYADHYVNGLRSHFVFPRKT